MTPDLIPQDEAGIAAAISAASEPLQICGNNTKERILRPVQAARSLSTSALTGITLYSPNELVLSAGAGTPLAEIRRHSRRQGPAHHLRTP